MSTLKTILSSERSYDTPGHFVCNLSNSPKVMYEMTTHVISSIYFYFTKLIFTNKNSLINSNLFLTGAQLDFRISICSIFCYSGLILVSEPYFNEAGYEKQRGTQQGQENSRMYNEMAVLKLVQVCELVFKN